MTEVPDRRVDEPDLRRLELPLGAVVEVRPTTADDADSIERLYEQLSERDRYRRFFTAFHPDERWCREWSSVADRGGFAVIAFLHDDDRGDVRPIADAGYALRPDGDGDLAITVAADRRGWLGGYLLDVIVDHARRAGIENLQAEMLAENRPMVALMRHRGAVYREHGGGIIRASIATDGRVPSWSPLDERPRVLVEVPGGRWTGEESATAAGLALAMCPGPERRRGGCPTLDGARCPLVDGADAVVVARERDDPTTQALIDAHRRGRPDLAVFVRRSGRQGDADDSSIIVGASPDQVIRRVIGDRGRRSALPHPMPTDEEEIR